jgi:phosphoribosyl-AMP cyclohydrolase / phosphoribosyl-ATP pyrophosphohydrolase
MSKAAVSRTALKLEDVDNVDFGKGGGLLPAVVQDVDTGSVLMLGYMNRDALESTFARRRVVFFSRSKARLWEKGETSGHSLDLVQIHTDCDHDTLLVTARPRGPICHLGSSTCFGDGPASQAERVAFLCELEDVIAKRISERPEGSYTARLFAAGIKRIAQKVGEEGLEVALAGAAGTEEELIAETADLLYHLLVLLKSRGLNLAPVVQELNDRHATGA